MAGSDYVQSVTRAIDIIEALSRQGGLDVDELARQLQLGSSTVQNLLRTLAHRQWVAKEGKPALYRPGPALVAALRMLDTEPFLARARRVMLAAQGALVGLQMTLTLSERDGLDIKARMRLLPSGRFEPTDTEVLPPYRKPSPLTYQAFGDAAFNEAFRRRWPFYDFSEARWANHQALDTFLDASRKRGAVVLGSEEEAKFSAACPVFSARREVIATVGVFGPYGEAAQRERTLSVLKQAAEKLSEFSE